jgi:hypothetical protein
MSKNKTISQLLQGISISGNLNIETGSILVGNTSVVNSTGGWVGSPTGLKGDTGTTGSTGAKGDTGTTGAKGDTGSKGDKGDTGLANPISISALSYTGDDLAVDTSTPLTCTITGANFVSNTIVYIDSIATNSTASGITVSNSNTISFTPPAKAAGNYNVWAVTPTGAIAVLQNGILYSGTPSWTGHTTSYNLTVGTAANIHLSATSSDTPITYSLVSGTLPTNTSLSSNGLISGTPNTAGSYPNIVVKANDAQNQDANITIGLTVSLAYTSYILLHLDGSNGSTTITDSSSFNRTFTASGAASLNTTTKKFGTASLAVGGTDKVSCSESIGVNSNDFTLEGWVYYGSAPTSWSGAPFSIGSNIWNDSNSLVPLFGVSVIRMSINGSFYDFTHGMSGGTWYHLCIQRNGNNFYVYRDGTQIGSTVTNSGSLSASGFHINGATGQGNMPAGSFVDDVRLVVGTNMYSLGGFTAPTGALI